MALTFVTTASAPFVNYFGKTTRNHGVTLYRDGAYVDNYVCESARQAKAIGQAWVEQNDADPRISLTLTKTLMG